MRYEYYVVAYDIVKTKRRNQVAKLLKSWGERVNYSVFECEIEKNKLNALRKEIAKLIKKDEDSVIYYPICLNCRAGAIYDGKTVERKFDETVLIC